MKVRMLWAAPIDDNTQPWLLAACCEATIDEWNGLPDFYREALEASPTAREVVVHVPNVTGLFEVPEVTAKIGGDS